MSTFKKTKVVMLSTNEKATVGSIVTRPSDNRMATVNVLTKDDTQPCIHQHLYFLSDEEIKEGDWFIGFADGSISPFVKQADESTVEINNWQLNKKGTSSNKKIIATTDKSLGADYNGAFGGLGKLPQPSQLFVEKFVEEYNKGNQITEVLVEYENIDMDFDPAELNGIKWKNKSKINPKNNTITIRKAKDSWSREEVKQLFDKMYALTDFVDINVIKVDFDKWIEENL